MPRKAREKSATGVYAVLITGAGSQTKLFFDDDDYEELISRLYDKLDGHIIAFALCETAICLIVRENERGIGWTVKPLTTSYARYYNSRYGADGALFGRRFKSMPIENAEEMASALACVHRLCEDTGMEGYTGLYEDDTLVIPEAALEIMGSREPYDKAYAEKDALIPFFAQITGKNQERKPAVRTAPAPKKAEKAETEKNAEAKTQKQSGTAAPEKAAETPAKKKRNNMPSWLL